MILIVNIFIFLVACEVSPPDRTDDNGEKSYSVDENGENDEEDENSSEPGDSDYLPPNWTAPSLAFDKTAYFPMEVTGYQCTPGQYINDTEYGPASNTEKLLGPPVGGGSNAADNSSIVTLGMAGGSVTVKFDPPIVNHADNIGGYDFIVFGNTFFQGADPESPWQEPGTIWVMKDENENGKPDDRWYLISGSHITASDSAETVVYDDADPAKPPPDEYKSSWWPDGESSPLTVRGIYILPDEIYSISGAPRERCWGYCDTTPTLVLGDLSGADGSAGDNKVDDPEDYPGIEAVYFYTVPDTHGDNKIDPGSGGGDAIKLEWAVDPVDFSAVILDQISWIKIVSGSLTTGPLGEFSCEVDAVSRVRRSQ